jgi:histidinol-phosphate aminotransferase
MAVAIAGGTMHETLLTPDWHIDLDAMRAAIRADTRVLYVCNPHNPTGTHVDPTALMSLVDAATAQGVVAIIDEAYIDFARGVTRSFVPDVKSGARAIVLRSFSKSYALAGIRVGYAIGSPEDIRAMMQISWSMPFSVNRVAQAIAGDALAAQDLLTERCNAVRSRKLRLYGMLEEYGIWYLRSATNFVFLRAPVATAADAEQAGVLVRDCSGFGNPGYWRVSVGSDAELAQFEAFLKSLKRRKNL